MYVQDPVDQFIIEVSNVLKFREKRAGPVVENESGKSTPLSDDAAPTPRHMEFMTNAELNLSCCILMLDILLKQVKSSILWDDRV